MQYRLGRRPDIAWLLDRWAREHASGWPPSSTTVIDIPLRHRLRPERCLDAIRERRRAGATLVAIVPARRARPTRWRVSSPTAASLERAARRAFPDATITVEPLGNDRVRAALAAGVHVSEVAPVELDRHDGESPMVWALAVDTALRVRR